MRAAIDAIFYLLRTGCLWRSLPRDEFPPRSTVYNIFRKFQKDGVREAICVVKADAHRPAPARHKIVGW